MGHVSKRDMSQNETGDFAKIMPTYQNETWHGVCREQESYQLFLKILNLILKYFKKKPIRYYNA